MNPFNFPEDAQLPKIKLNGIFRGSIFVPAWGHIRSSKEELRWAHNPEVGRSKLPSVTQTIVEWSRTPGTAWRRWFKSNWSDFFLSAHKKIWLKAQGYFSQPQSSTFSRSPSHKPCPKSPMLACPQCAFSRRLWRLSAFSSLCRHHRHRPRRRHTIPTLPPNCRSSRCRCQTSRVL